MKHLVSEWPKIKAQLRSYQKTGLFLDFDGTLADIANDPARVVLKKSVRGLLQALARKKNLVVGILSGRKMAELVDIVAVRGIYYSGNHGLEIQGPGFSYLHPAARTFGPYLNSVVAQLEKSLRGISGVILERKEYSLSVHFRLVARKEVKKVREEVKRATKELLARKRIKVTRGNKVLEVRPPLNWDKGDALRTIRHRTLNDYCVVIFIGDDVTDEDALAALHTNDWPVRVGAKNGSHARYFLKSPEEVEAFLNRLEGFL